MTKDKKQWQCQEFPTSLRVPSGTEGTCTQNRTLARHKTPLKD